MAKIWVAVKVVAGNMDVLASTSLAEVSRGVGCSVWTLRRLKREMGKDGDWGFWVQGKDGDELLGVLPWYVVRVELRRVEGRGKGGRTGYRLKGKNQ